MAQIDIDRNIPPPLLIPYVSNISRLMDASLLLLVRSINELLPCFIISFIEGGPLEAALCRTVSSFSVKILLP